MAPRGAGAADEWRLENRLHLSGPEAHAKMRSTLVLEGLRSQGFREPDQVIVVVRAAGGDRALMKPLLAELVASKTDILLIGGGSTMTVAASTATANIPIVTLDLELDPIESGLLKSLAHPGGNVTGVFLDLPELSTALLELLKQAMPSLTGIVVLWDPATYTAQRKAVVAAGRRRHGPWPFDHLRHRCQATRRLNRS